MSLWSYYSLPETIGTGAVFTINVDGVSAVSQVGTLTAGVQTGSISGVAASSAVGSPAASLGPGKLHGTQILCTGAAGLLSITVEPSIPDVYATGAATLLIIQGSAVANPLGVSADCEVSAPTIGGGASAPPTGVNATGVADQATADVEAQSLDAFITGAASPLLQFITSLPGVFTQSDIGWAIAIDPTPKVVLLVTGSTWTVPPDWNSTENTISVIGGGGGGANGVDGAGGGGGGYATVSNVPLTPNSVIQLNIGQGGVGGTAGTVASPGTSGGDTWFGGTSLATSIVGAHGGAGGTTAAGAGGSTTGAIGTTKFAGGAGGGKGSLSGGGGGGAAGPVGAGAQGGTGSYAGAGGGGDGGGTAGTSSTNAHPGAGGNNSSGTGSGAPGVIQTAPDGSAGTAGGGGGGGYGDQANTGLGTFFSPGSTFVGRFSGGGGAGGPGTDWGAQGGSGGGGGGGGSTTGSQIGMPGGAGGLYGGGGAAGGLGTANGFGDAGGNGAQGAILITWITVALQNVGAFGNAAVTAIGSIMPDPSVPLPAGVSTDGAAAVVPEITESLGPDSVHATAKLGNIVYDEFGIIGSQSSNAVVGNISAQGSNPVPQGVFGSGIVGFPTAEELSSTLQSVFGVGEAAIAISAPLASGVFGLGQIGAVSGVVPPIQPAGVFGLGAIGSFVFLTASNFPVIGVDGVGTVGSLQNPGPSAEATNVIASGAVGSLAASLSLQLNGVHGTGSLGTILVSEFTSVVGAAESGVVGTLAAGKLTNPIGVLSATAVGVLIDQIGAAPAGAHITGTPGLLTASVFAPTLGVFGTGAAGIDTANVEAQSVGAKIVGSASALSDALAITSVLGVFSTGAFGALTEIIGGHGQTTGVNAVGALGAFNFNISATPQTSGVWSQGSVGFGSIAEGGFDPSVFATGLIGVAVAPAPATGVFGSGKLGTIVVGDSPQPFGAQTSGTVGTVIAPKNVIPIGVASAGAPGNLTALFEATYPGVFTIGEPGSLVMVRAAMSGVEGTGTSGILLASSLYLPSVSSTGAVGNPSVLIVPGTPIKAPPAPYNYVLPGLISFPDQLLPSILFNMAIKNNGVRLGWMKSHACACTMTGNIPGAPNPSCNTCHGRGRWWEPPSQAFTGLMTFMHTMEASDEPGVAMDSRFGVMAHAEPTITIPSDVQPCWSMCSLFDAFVEQDALTRFETVLTVGGMEVLPYQQNLQILSVTAYDTARKIIVPLGPASYSVNGGRVSLIGFPAGTSYTVSYNASPVYVVWRRVGGLPHQRPFGAGTAALPTRFRAMSLDLWTRARNSGLFSASPEAL